MWCDRSSIQRNKETKREVAVEIERGVGQNLKKVGLGNIEDLHKMRGGVRSPLPTMKAYRCEVWEDLLKIFRLLISKKHSVQKV